MRKPKRAIVQRPGKDVAKRRAKFEARQAAAITPTKVSRPKKTASERREGRREIPPPPAPSEPVSPSSIKLHTHPR